MKNFAAVGPGTIVSFAFLINTASSSNQSFQASIYNLKSDGTLAANPGYQQNITVGYNSSGFTFAVKTGSNCNQTLSSNIVGAKLCFITSGLTTSAGSKFTISTNPFITPNLSNTTYCQTTSSWTNTSANNTCSITAGDTGFFIGDGLSNTPATQIEIDSTVNDQGCFSISSLDLFGIYGTNTDNLLLEFYATYNGAQYSYLQVSFTATNESFTTQVVNAGKDSSIQASLLLIRGTFSLGNLPDPNTLEPRFVAYFNPSKFLFSSFSDYLSNLSPYPCNTNTNSTPSCTLIKGSASSDYRLWHKVVVRAGFSNLQDVKVHIPIEQVTFANGDIQVQTEAYDDSNGVAFPVELNSVSFPNTAPSTISSLPQGSLAFTNSMSVGSVIFSITFSYHLGSSLSTGNPASPNDISAFVIFVPWDLKSSMSDIIDTDGFSTYYINYTTTAGTLSYRSMVVIYLTSPLSNGTSDSTILLGILAPSTVNIPAYWAYLVDIDGHAIAGVQNTQQTGVLALRKKLSRHTSSLFC